ncbi:MAG: non-ribosomal peptide synthetase [Candidatus Magasanikbacteria bacterium]|nr:non-ribosomal peptide synthetase [Candidatus Magasanikbacteria bacterium]
MSFPGRIDITYSEFDRRATQMRRTLLQLGIEPGDRVALVLPNSAEMIILSISILSFATLAPLNPKYKKTEFDFYLSDLKPKAIIIPDGEETPAISTAEEKGILILCLEKETGRIFPKNGNENIISEIAEEKFSGLDDTALVLHTSGTTSRPKIVPLTQRNIFASASNLVRTLHLTPEDKCLNVMPLFHIHSFVVSLAVLISGGTLICPAVFVAEDFFDWLDMYRPSWYTAAPTIHLAILKEAEKNQNILEKIKLKMIRSSSAPMSKEVILKLEEIFKAPVLESYGMTEAALQITSNQFPPDKRKPGSAGRADGPELIIVGDDGQKLETGEVGEILIKGNNVILSYENNEEANENSFFNGWFRTGDLGYLDSDNFLFITGRSKEMINKGGEKISPREIDEVLMQHEAIYQALTFSVPHPSLGEEVGVAIIIEKDFTLSKTDLQKFAKEYLADFKIPQLIVFVDDIPKGPTGKLQRIGLYNKLKNMNILDNNMSQESEKNETEKTLLKIWQKVLAVENLSVEDNFFEMGGDSLKIKEVICLANEAGLEIEAEEMLSYPCVRSLVANI